MVREIDRINYNDYTFGLFYKSIYKVWKDQDTIKNKLWKMNNT